MSNLSLSNYVKKANVNHFLEQQLGSKKTQFVSNMLALTDSDKMLAQCDPDKLIKCAMNATALNVSLNKNLGHAYVIPFKNKDKIEPQFILGYKGFIQLAIKTGEYERLNSVVVRSGEIEINKFTGEVKFLGENPDGEIVGYIAYMKLKSGFEANFYATEKEIDNHAKKYSKSYQYDLKNKKRTSPWSDPDEREKMALKTVLKKLLSTYGLLTQDMEKAYDVDLKKEVTEDIPHEEPKVESNLESNIKTVNIDDF